jgi:hypothetical protein
MLVAAEDFRSKKPVWFDVEDRNWFVGKMFENCLCGEEKQGGKKTSRILLPCRAREV